MPQLLLPALEKEIQSYGGPAPQLQLEQGPMPVVGETCWQIRGELPGERRFWVCFTKEDIQAPKTFALAEAGSLPSLLESFLIDEKRITLALLVIRWAVRYVVAIGWFLPAHLPMLLAQEVSQRLRIR